MKVSRNIARWVRALAEDLDKYDVALGPESKPTKVSRASTDGASSAILGSRDVISTGPHSDECDLLLRLLVTEWQIKRDSRAMATGGGG